MVRLRLYRVETGRTSVDYVLLGGSTAREPVRGSCCGPCSTSVSGD